MESNETLSWLHHRTPAILSTDDMVQDWLDTERVSSSRAVTMLTPVSNLAWHAVSTSVNNARNKDPNCNKPMTSSKASFSPLKNWLQTGCMKKRGSDTMFTDKTECKKSKETL